MKKLVAIFVSVFVGLLFLSNIGISFNKHFCKKDGIKISYFHKVDHECKLVEKKPTCCQSKVVDDDCCKDEIVYHHVKFDFSNAIFKFKLNQPIVISLIPIWTSFIEVYDYPILFSEFPIPPPKLGREVLLQKQVLRL